MKNYYNYLYTKKLNLNLNDIHESNVRMNQIVMECFYEDSLNNNYMSKAAKTTKVFDRYNVFLYPFKGYHELFTSTQKMFHEVANPQEPHYIQAWLNVYQKGDFIDWHSHWDADKKVWHGFYCADVETQDSHTLYRIPGVEEELKIDSVNNLLVLGKSENDEHKSSEWNVDHPRVTIAFDIIPYWALQNGGPLNHYIPI